MKKGKAMAVTASVARNFIHGSQTQHRVPIHPQPDEDGVCLYLPTGKYMDTSEREYKPRYLKGDTIWLREPGRVHDWNEKDGNIYVTIKYLADDAISKPIKLPERLVLKGNKKPKWVREKHGVPNGIFKEAGRHFFEVLDVRPHRIQDISNAEALFEGIKRSGDFFYALGHPLRETPREAFFDLWDSLYKEDGLNVESNPWCWSWTVKKIEGPAS